MSAGYLKPAALRSRSRGREAPSHHQTKRDRGPVSWQSFTAIRAYATCVPRPGDRAGDEPRHGPYARLPKPPTRSDPREAELDDARRGRYDGSSAQP